MIYLDNAASTHCLECVMDAIHDANSEWSNVHRGFHRHAVATSERFEEARGQVADFIQADPEEIVFTSGTTDALNMVAQGLDLGPGDMILVTEMDHHSNIVPWQQVARDKGCDLRMVPLLKGEIDTDYLEALLQMRPRVFAFPAVSNVLGTANPVAKLTRMAHEQGTLVVVDAAQSIPHIPHFIHQMGVDFLAFSGHKLHAPTGIGALYVQKRLFPKLKPVKFGGGAALTVSSDDTMLREGFSKLEAGTPPIQQAIGLGRACEYWRELGMERVHQHVRALTYEAYVRLEAQPGVHILGPPRHRRIGIVSFTVDRIHAHDVAALLAERDIAVRAGHHCAMPLHQALGITSSVRVSFSHFNQKHEIDFLIEALMDIQESFASL
jgi:cysteine desulfurase/selenocysteine lyase